MVFGDISKAFDRVWHTGLLFKLKRIGIDGALLRWFESYLSHRTQRVVLQGCSSDWRNIGAVVPQGSVLGPIMFLVYINDMKDDLQSSLSLFADDNLMHISSNSDKTNKNILNSDGIMKTWANQWLIKFSVEKTKSMFVRYQGNTDDKLIFKNHDLDNVSEYKHLLVIIQSNLSWNSHIDYICKKASKRLDILDSVSHKLSRKSLETMYFSYVRSILEYADILFCNTS